MKPTGKNVALVSIISGFVGFGMICAFSVFFWQIYPYPENANETQITLVWSMHGVAEKVFGTLVMVVCAIGAARLLREDWRYGIVAGIGSGLACQVIAIVAYLARFGNSAYLMYNRFWSTIGTAILISALFGFIAVWGSYRREQRALSTDR